ncbi:MAG: hypothetical protein ACPG5B_06685 [Chitinophagales bacterium]
MNNKNTLMAFPRLKTLLENVNEEIKHTSEYENMGYTTIGSIPSGLELLDYADEINVEVFAATIV